MLTTALSLPISQYHCVTMATISGIYSKRAYSSKLQHRLLVKVQPMSHGPLLSLTGEYYNISVIRYTAEMSKRFAIQQK